MEYIKATEENTEQIYNLVQDTIRTIYPKYYPKEVVDFFCELHSMQNIREDVRKGYIDILLIDNHIIGTGSHKENHITRVFVAPSRQGNGYGSFIMQNLEDKIAINHNKIYLDASLPASHLYEMRGYQTIKHNKWEVANGAVLIYEVMEREALLRI